MRLIAVIKTEVLEAIDCLNTVKIWCDVLLLFFIYFLTRHFILSISIPLSRTQALWFFILVHPTPIYYHQQDPAKYVLRHVPPYFWPVWIVSLIVCVLCVCCVCCVCVCVWCGVHCVCAIRYPPVSCSPPSPPKYSFFYFLVFYVHITSFWRIEAGNNFGGNALLSSSSLLLSLSTHACLYAFILIYCWLITVTCSWYSGIYLYPALWKSDLLIVCCMFRKRQYLNSVVQKVPCMLHLTIGWRGNDIESAPQI